MTAIQPALANIPSTTSSVAAAAGAAKGSAADTEHRFLALMVAQLKNQDPLNPMDNSEITTQLAQISTVNGVEQLNSSMKTLAGGFDGMQTVQAASLAGRQIMADGTALALENGSASGGFNLDQPVEQLSVTILDAAGAQVQRVDLGPQEAGIHGFQWDGMNDAGQAAAPGSYSFKVQGLAQNKQIAAQSLASTPRSPPAPSRCRRAAWMSSRAVWVWPC